MADTSNIQSDKKDQLDVPENVMKDFGDLIKLIKRSKSMDLNERQYWVDVLPIMSEDQIENLRNILNNEKKELDEAESDYAGEMKKNVKEAVSHFDEAAYITKKQARVEAEKMAEKEEKKEEDNILSELDNL